MDGLLPKDPCDLEEVLDAAIELVDSADFGQAVETHEEIVLVCVYAELADRLARYGIDEEKRVAIARLGRDRKFERADELFKILSD